MATQLCRVSVADQVSKRLYGVHITIAAIETEVLYLIFLLEGIKKEKKNLTVREMGTVCEGRRILKQYGRCVELQDIITDKLKIKMLNSTECEYLQKYPCLSHRTGDHHCSTPAHLSVENILHT